MPKKTWGEQLLVAAAVVELVSEVDRAAQTRGHGAKERVLGWRLTLRASFILFQPPPWYAAAYTP